tara:strand:- start:237 stop:920 length:684 start_codon:yes stop_codon:yes gene_type:complete
MKKFLLGSLIAAGFFSYAESFEIDKTAIDDDQISLKNNTKGLDALINTNLPYTLMAHSSHSSHGSHSSHSSHGSHYSYGHVSSGHSSHASHSSHYSHYSYGSVEGQNQNYSYNYKDQGLGRNLNSTPSESILPRTPAIVESNKVNEKEKIKGRSEKFILLTQRVQLSLYAMGYYTGEIDGMMNNEIVTSITKYQKKHNLKITGSLTDELIAYLDVGLIDLEKQNEKK